MTPARDIQRDFDAALREHRAGQLDRAGQMYRAILSAHPDHVSSLQMLGMLLLARGDVSEATALLRELVRLCPGAAQAHAALGAAVQHADLAEAIACYRKSLELKPDSRVASNLVYALHFHPDYDPKRLFEEHSRWNQTYARPLTGIAPHANDRSPKKRLRVGYVSPDFRRHPVGRFLLPLLAHHDPEAVEVFCYSDVRAADSMTERLKSHAHVWRDTAALDDAQLANQVRADRIDILVDLTMHMEGNRLLTFARKPAAVQVTYLAYCSTTGVETMDYRLTDPYLDPPGSDETVYSEKTIRLPRTYWCYLPPEDAPRVQSPPSISTGSITFGCLNNFAKVTPPTLDVWRELLRQLPGSRLLLHCVEGGHRERIHRHFGAAGIDPSRIEFVGFLNRGDYLGQYHRIDIALDPFPYPGGTTTCDALWMGVPVVSLAGATAVSRSGLSILSNVGLPELVARTSDEYLRIALQLAQDPPRVGALRSGLRRGMQASPLMDASTFAHDFEAAYRFMWQAWCATAS